jgi:hypothetical protein
MARRGPITLMSREPEFGADRLCDWLGRAASALSSVGMSGFFRGESRSYFASPPGLVTCWTNAPGK